MDYRMAPTGGINPFQEPIAVQQSRAYSRYYKIADRAHPPCKIFVIVYYTYGRSPCVG